MFSLRNFIKKGLLDAVGKMADYQVILNSTGWYEKNVLFEEDLAEINIKIEEQYYQGEIEENTNETVLEETEKNIVENIEIESSIEE